MNFMAILQPHWPTHLTPALVILLYVCLTHVITLLFSLISTGVLGCEIVDGTWSTSD